MGLDTILIFNLGNEKVCMIRKYNNHTLQTNQRLHEEKPHTTYSRKISGRQLKQSNQLSLPRQEDFKTRKDTKLCRTKRRLTWHHHRELEVYKTMNRRQQHHRLRTASAKATGA